MTEAQVEAKLDTESASRLCDLGVTRLTILRNETDVLVVLEGWALDPIGSAKAVEVLFQAEMVRSFLPVAEMSLLPQQSVGARNDGA